MSKSTVTDRKPPTKPASSMKKHDGRGKKRKSKPTFFTKKSKEINATIIKRLRSICSDRIFNLTGIAFSEYYQCDGDYVRAPQSSNLLFLLEDLQARYPEPANSERNLTLTEAYMWSRRFDGLHTKNLSLELGIDTEAAALIGFREAEKNCRKTNERLTNLNLCNSINGLHASTIIDGLRRKIAGYLGECPQLADLKCSFGPGSNPTCKRRTSAKWKLNSIMACSEDARGSLRELMRLYPTLNWGTITLGCGELFFVPKNAKIMRTCEQQPLLNMFIQRGQGKFIKRLLLKKGCNLYDQSINKEMARISSITGENATVDLSAASDNIAFKLVALLLSPEWFEFLANWRTDKVYYPPRNEYIPLQKFSAMGNGYTFELESCIFYACAQLACELTGENPKSVSVYGDDIVLPVGAYDTLKSIFDLVGFSINDEKSFSTGPFRESCGGDYLFGIDVRPFYAKDAMTDARLTCMSNQVARSGYPDEEYRQAIESWISPEFKLFGPEGFGDGHLIGYEWIGKPSHHHSFDLSKNSGFEGYTFRTYSKVPATDDEEPLGFRRLPAYLAYLQEDTLSLSAQLYLAEKERYLVHRNFRDKPDFSKKKPVSYSLDADPHVLGGGETARVTRVYVPTNSLM
jgi:hypothetical protein